MFFTAKKKIRIKENLIKLGFKEVSPLVFTLNNFTVLLGYQGQIIIHQPFYKIVNLNTLKKLI